MSEIQDIIIPALGGLNSDDDISVMPVNDSPCSITQWDGRLNIEIKEGSKGIISNAQGNVQHSIIGGTVDITDIVLGTVEDRENNGIIIFIYNSSQGYRIYRYNFDGTFTYIFGSGFLNFNANYKIHAKIIGEGENSFLIFTDGYGEPGCINLQSISLFHSSVFSISMIKLMKPFPSVKPTVTISNDTNYKTNNIIGYTFQFIYRYVYQNNEKSHFSVPSDLIFNYKNEFPNGISSVNSSLSNRLDIAYRVEYENVRKVEIYFRYGDVGGGIYSVWYLADIVDYFYVAYPSTVIGNKIFYFYHDKVYSVANQDDINIPYYDVPRSANNIEVLYNNRVALSNPKRGYDNVNINVTFDTVNVLSSAYTVTGHTPPLGGSTYADVNVVKGTTETYHQIYITEIGSSSYKKYVIGSDYNKASTDVLIDYFVSEINSDKGDYTDLTASRVSSKLRITNAGTATSYRITWNSMPLVSAGTYNHVMKSFPPGCFVNMGIVYYDEYGRMWRSQVNSQTTIYIPTIAEETLLSPFAQMIKYTITHRAPTGAKYYQFVFGGQSIKDYYILPILVKNTFLNNTKDVEFDGDIMYINIPQAISRGINQYHVNKINTFDVKSGDRIRFMGYFVFSGLTFNITNIAPWDSDEIIELEVLWVDADGRIAVKNIDSYNNASFIKGLQAYNYIAIEVYSLNKNLDKENSYYFAVGDLLSISSSNGYHIASVPSGISTGVTAQNQTSVLPAVGVINFGTMYAYPSSFYEDKLDGDVFYILMGNCIRQYSSKLYLSKNFELGKISSVDKEFSEKTDNAVVWGGKLSTENLNYNELNKFLSEDIMYFDDKYGGIYDLQEKGYVLNVIQRSKITHVDIERIVQSLPDGTQSYVSTDAILGTKRPSPVDLGSVYSFTIVQTNYGVVGYDIYSGDVWIIDGNGVNSLTEGKYKMKKYFRDKSNLLLTSGIDNVFCCAGYDPINKLYLLTFIDSITETNNETIAFSFELGRWFTKYSFIPRFYNKIGDSVFITIADEISGVHYADRLFRHHYTNINTFYGVVYNSEIKIVSNKNPQIEKRFDTISEISNAIWEAPDTDSIIVNPNAIEHSDPMSFTKHYLKMQSELKESQFKLDEGEYKAEFLRDYLTTSSTPKVTDLLNGRLLVGNEIVIKLENNDTVPVYLKMIKVNSTISSY